MDGNGGRGWLQAAREDGPDGRPGLGTIPTHKFRVLASSILYIKETKLTVGLGNKIDDIVRTD